MATPDFSPKTVKETRGFIDRNLLPALGPVPLSKLKASDLDRFYRKLSVDGGSRSGPLAPGTVRRIHGILRRALGQGLKWGWIGVNPAVPCGPSTKSICFDDAVAESFWASLKHECIRSRVFATRAEARRAIFRWITWYNTRRLHSSLNYTPPAKWEQQYPQAS